MHSTKTESLLNAIEPNVYAHAIPSAVLSDLVQSFNNRHHFHQTRAKTLGVTLADLHRLPSNLSDDDFWSIVLLYIGHNSPMLHAREEAICTEFVNTLREAQEYLHNYLNITLQHDPIAINSLQDVMHFIRHITTYTGTVSSLPHHASRCALLTTALAVRELHRQSAHTLEEETDRFKAYLTHPSEENNFAPLFHLKPHYGKHVPKDNELMCTIAGLSSVRHASLSFRGKSHDSLITKFLIKPEANADMALSDGVGMRIEVPRHDLISVIEHVVSALHHDIRLGARKLHIENTGLLSEHDMYTLHEKLSGIAKFKNDINPNSSTRLQILKINGLLCISQGESNVCDVERAFEVQVVPTENRNESGLANHAVYDALKKVTVMTRLFGGCSHTWMKQHIHEMTREAHLDADNVIRRLIRNGRIIKLPGRAGPGRTHRYAASAVYKRWCATEGFLPTQFRKDVLHELARHKAI